VPLQSQIEAKESERGEKYGLLVFYVYRPFIIEKYAETVIKVVKRQHFITVLLYK